jgi:pyruvate/2-oxoacid:ferredoxin oxidoreductase alpha subunit
MGTKRLLNGNQAAAEAARLAQVQVFPAYPITPEAPLMASLVGAIEQGRLNCRFIRVESEHSAAAAAVGASLAGARTFSATNSQGLALMHELLFASSGLRLPIVMAIVNRALSAPHSRFPDHGDAIAQEASGWLQLYCENNQEALDTVIQAFRVAEDERVLLPAMVNFEGYILGHTKEVVDVPEQGEVDAFLPPYGRVVLDVANPASINTATSPEFYTEYKYRQHAAMQNAAAVISETSQDYAKMVGRDWGGTVDLYRAEDAETLLLAMGSIVSTARLAVDQLRADGKRVGLLKVRAFRPFPAAEIRQAAGLVKALAVIDRDVIFGAGGALYREVQCALAEGGLARPVIGYIAGLGGRDVGVPDLLQVAQATEEAAQLGSVAVPVRWLGLKEQLL